MGEVRWSGVAQGSGYMNNMVLMTCVCGRYCFT